MGAGGMLDRGFWVFLEGLGGRGGQVGKGGKGDRG